MRNTILILILMTLAWPAHAEGLDALIEVGRAQGEIKKHYDDETRAYERVRSAVNSGAIKTGMTAAEISSRYGEPVVNYKEYVSQKKAWVYKPAKTDFLGGGPRITLYFDSSETLTEIVPVEN